MGVGRRKAISNQFLLLSTAVMLATFCRACPAEDATALYAKGFGDRDAEVRAAHSPTQTTAFAHELLDSADQVKDDPAYQEVLINKAYEIGMLYPDGLGTAVEAMEKLIRLHPDEKDAADQKLLAAMAKQCHAPTPAQRRSATDEYVAKVLEIADDLAAGGKYEAASLMCAKAKPTAEAFQQARVDLAAGLQRIREEQGLVRHAQELKASLAASPSNRAAARELVQLLVLDRDDPEQAMPWIEATEDASLKHAMPLATRDLAELSEAESLELADWYHAQARKSERRASYTAWTRSKAAYQHFLELHTREDADRLNARRAIDDANSALSKLPPSASSERIVNLIASVDIEKDIIRGWGHLARKNGGLTYDGAWSDGQYIIAFRTPYHPAAEYDLRMTFVKPQDRGNLQLIMAHGENRFLAEVDFGDSHECKIEGWTDDKAVHTAQAISLGDPHRLVVQVRRSVVSMYIDDKLVSRRRTDKEYNGLPWWVYAGDGNLGLSAAFEIEIQSMDVVEVRGRGHFGRSSTFGVVPSLSAPPPNDRPRRIVDLMPLIDPKNAVKGTWTRKGDELLSDGSPVARLEISYAPPEEYDFRVDFTRTEDLQDIILFASHASHDFSLMVGGFGNSVCGLGNINGQSPEANPTTVRGPAIIRNGRKYSAVVYVRKDYVAASINGKLIAKYKTDFSDMSPLGPWTIRTGILGVGTHFSSTVFHSIQIAEITGEGKSTEPGREVRTLPIPKEQISSGKNPLTVDKPAGPRTPSPNPRVEGGSEPRHVINLLPFIKPSEAKRGFWEMRSGELIDNTPDGPANVRIEYSPPEEYDFRIEFTVMKGSTLIQMLSHAQRNFMWVSGARCGFDLIDGRDCQTNATRVDRPDLFTAGVHHVGVVQVRRDGITTLIDGKQISDYKTDYSHFAMDDGWNVGDKCLGLGSWASCITFHGIDLAEVTGHGSPITGQKSAGK